MRHSTVPARPLMELADWKRVIDELAAHSVGGVLIRGGEPFLFPGIIELLHYIAAHKIYIAIDTNGTLLGRYAQDLVNIETSI